VSGWQQYSIQVDKEGIWNGQGKQWRDDGSMYVGGYKDQCKTQGKKYELQTDGTHTLFHVRYDERGKVKARKEISEGH
jgi:hypothetical protein